MTDFVDPILNGGGLVKLNPPPVGPAWGATEGFAGGPKVNTPPEVLFVAPNALAPPN